LRCGDDAARRARIGSAAEEVACYALYWDRLEQGRLPTAAGPNGSAFDIHYAAANRSVTVTPIGALAVESRLSLPGRVRLAVLR
jgi:hypothetical protein